MQQIGQLLTVNLQSLSLSSYSTQYIWEWKLLWNTYKWNKMCKLLKAAEEIPGDKCFCDTVRNVKSVWPWDPIKPWASSSWTTTPLCPLSTNTNLVLVVVQLENQFAVPLLWEAHHISICQTTRSLHKCYSLPYKPTLASKQTWSIGFGPQVVIAITGSYIQEKGKVKLYFLVAEILPSAPDVCSS